MTDGYTDLHWAAATCHVEKLHAALASPGCDVNARTTRQGWTALHIAARSGFLPVIDALLADGRINAQLRDADGQSALHIASDCNHTAAANCLMATGGSEEADRARGRMDIEERTRQRNDAKYGLSTSARKKREADEEQHAQVSGSPAGRRVDGHGHGRPGGGGAGDSSQTQPAPRLDASTPAAAQRPAAKPAKRASRRRFFLFSCSPSCSRLGARPDADVFEPMETAPTGRSQAV